MNNYPYDRPASDLTELKLKAHAYSIEVKKGQKHENGFYSEKRPGMPVTYQQLLPEPIIVKFIVDEETKSGVAFAQSYNSLTDELTFDILTLDPLAFLPMDDYHEDYNVKQTDILTEHEHIDFLAVIPDSIKR